MSHLDSFVESTPPGRSIIPPSGRYAPSPMVVRHYSPRKSPQVLHDSTSSTGIRLTVLLLIISSVFVLCTSPTSILRFIREDIPEYNSTKRWQSVQLAFTLLMYLNHTVKRPTTFCSSTNRSFFRSISFCIV